MHAQIVVAAVAFGTLSVTTASVAATPADDFDSAKASFRTGDFNQVISLVTGLLYPPPAKLSAERDLIDAHLLLGVSYFQTGNRSAAAEQFEEALLIDFTLTISPPLFSTDASEFFSSEKKAFERKYKAEKELLEKREEAARLQYILDNMLVSERRLFYANFIPFGVGQFQNGDRGKGIFFLTSQIAMVGASTGLFTYQLLRYSDGKVPRDEVDQVETLQILQVSTGALAIGLMVAGILDAWYNYQPTVLRKPDKKLLEQWEKLREELPGRKKKTSALDTLKFLPTATDTSIGAAVFLEF